MEDDPDGAAALLAAFPGAIDIPAERENRRKLALAIRKHAPEAPPEAIARAATFIHVRSHVAGRAPSKSEIDGQIRRLDAATTEMIDALRDMRLDARSAIPETSPDRLDQLQKWLNWTFNFKSQNPTVAPTGLRKRAARAAAREAVRQYELLTGNRATVITDDGKAGGPYVGLLADVFEALGIKKASAESQARTALGYGKSKAGNQS